MSGMSEIGPGLGVFLMMNNYFHDVATALLAASGAVMALIVIRYGQAGDETARKYFAGLYMGMAGLARFTLFWILLGGIPRTLYFRDYEWRNALDHGQVPALIIKHVLALTFVALGAWLWGRYSGRASVIIDPGADSPSGG